jgi:hypothetical protein
VDVDLHLQRGGQRVDHRDAHAVQAAGHRVAVAVELAACVQLGQDDLDRRLLVLGVHLHRDTAAVVDDPGAAVGEEGDLDPRRVACHRLVDRVVHDLGEQVVETAFAGGADVHAGPLSHGLEALQLLDGGRVVLMVVWCCHGRGVSLVQERAQNSLGQLYWCGRAGVGQGHP